LALVGLLRRRREPVHVVDEESGSDPRAEELRRRLAESRSVEVEELEPEVEDPESRRRAVHESARETVDRMRERK
jgi:hypothetical protein